MIFSIIYFRKLCHGSKNTIDKEILVAAMLRCINISKIVEIDFCFAIQEMKKDHFKTLVANYLASTDSIYFNIKRRFGLKGELHMFSLWIGFLKERV